MFSEFKSRIYKGVALIGIMLLIISIFLATTLERYRPMVDTYMNTTSVRWESVDKGIYNFNVDEELNTTDKLVAAHIDHATRVQEEGTVLLKNSVVGGKAALPLTNEAKITLFGVGSYSPHYGGQMGSDILLPQTVTLIEALKEKGFKVNPVMEEVYTKIGKKPGTLSMAMSMGGDYKKFYTNEASLEELSAANADYRDSYAQYSDAAVVVFSRSSTEAGDYFPGQDGRDPAEGGSENALGLDAKERAILQEAKDNFDTVIVMLNCVSQMEIDELKNDPKVDAVLWIGMMGNYGSLGIANLLRGEDDNGEPLSPSGKLYATYAADSTSAPATQNFGFYRWANWNTFETSIDAKTYNGNEFLVMAEGIYVGYRYYETRYYDSIMRPQSNASSTAGDFIGNNDGWKYTDEVSYSFGYGLSYTDFSYKMSDVVIADDLMTATVKGEVKNEGEVDGKTAVQIYVQQPYIEGGMEKSAIQLADYEKTPVIKAGETYEFSIDVDLSYIATYDYAGEGTYVMDGGDYYFAVGNGAHDALNNILAKQGKTTVDGMDYDGNAEAVIVKTPFGESGTDKTVFSVSKNGVEVKNQLQDCDLNYYIDDSVKYLSRTDYQATFPKTYDNIAATDEMIALLKNDTYEITSNEAEAKEINFATGVDNGMTFGQMKGASYTDERWDDLLAQIDLTEWIDTVARAQDIILACESINMPDIQVAGDALGIKRELAQYADANAPWWYGEDPADDKNAGVRLRDSYPLIPVLCSTFNKDLAYERGVLLGHVSLYSGVAVNWGPCLNLQRSPYYGRAHENSGEEPILGGYQAAYLAQGAWTKGCAVTLKHFIGNNIEINRVGLSQFNNEQAWRETELRGFQVALENGAKGVMTSYSRVGCKWSGSNRNLITNILKNEWGVHGYIVSDMIHNQSESQYMAVKEAVAAGTAVMDNSTDFISSSSSSPTWSYMTADNIKNDPVLMASMKESAKDLLWLLANSNVLNGQGERMRMVNILSPWRVAYIVALVVSGAVFLTAGGLYVCSVIKSKKKES